MLAGADVAFGSAVRAAGFRLYTAETAPLLAEQARRILDRQRMEQSAGQPALRTLIGQHFRVEPGSVNASLLWKMVSTPSGAERYLSAMKKAGEATAGLQPERVVQLAALVTDEARLTRTAQMTLNAGSGWMGLGPRMGWLLLVSMLVCGIGICNAMLMTVTERFREIATLKCLGALDETIMLMFVLESCLLGSVGGCCGAILGSVIGLGRMLAAFGASAARSLPAAGMLMGMAAAVGAGIVLAAIAAVYPAFRAARLAPMEAMRIE
jgi:putative ABC transport system permease protein